MPMDVVAEEATGKGILSPSARHQISWVVSDISVLRAVFLVRVRWWGAVEEEYCSSRSASLR